MGICLFLPLSGSLPLPLSGRHMTIHRLTHMTVHKLTHMTIHKLPHMTIHKLAHPTAAEVASSEEACQLSRQLMSAHPTLHKWTFWVRGTNPLTFERERDGCCQIGETK